MRNPPREALVMTEQTGIVVAADDAVLDCAGHIISGTGAGHGVESVDHKNVTIKNCVIQGFESGIYLASTDGRKKELLSIIFVENLEIQDIEITEEDRRIYADALKSLGKPVQPPETSPPSGFARPLATPTTDVAF